MEPLYSEVIRLTILFRKVYFVHTLSVNQRIRRADMYTKQAIDRSYEVGIPKVRRIH